MDQISKIQINIPGKEYPLIFRKGLADGLGSAMRKLFAPSKAAVITDENVAGLYGSRISESLREAGFIVSMMVVPPGEGSKSLAVLSGIYDQLVEAELTRDDLIITLGGGVVGDLGGFAAASYLRGVPFIQVPTTLLAQIDSSIGGKVGVDLPGGKNLVGAFYQPKAVYIDDSFLKTLAPRYLKDGMGEVIKYACIRDGDLFTYLENCPVDEVDFARVITTCCGIKKTVVEGDEMDRGERMLLNFGHTLGHALEKYFNYEKLTHGEGVAVGMHIFTKNSESMGLTIKGTVARLLGLLEKFGLPTALPPVDCKEILGAIRSDKKNMVGGLNVVLLERIGKGFIRQIPRDEAGIIDRLIEG